MPVFFIQNIVAPLFDRWMENGKERPPKILFSYILRYLDMIYLSKIFSWFAFIKRPDEPILAKILAFGPLLSFGVFFTNLRGLPMS